MKNNKEVDQFGSVTVDLPSGLVISHPRLVSLRRAFELAIATVCEGYDMKEEWLQLELKVEGTCVEDWESAQRLFQYLGIPCDPTGGIINFNFGAQKTPIYAIITGWKLTREYFVDLFFDPITVGDFQIYRLLHFIPSSFGAPILNDSMQGWRPERVGNSSSSEDTITGFIFHPPLSSVAKSVAQQ